MKSLFVKFLVDRSISLVNLHRHTNMYLGIGKLKCDICDGLCSSQADLNDHVMSAYRGINVIYCDICGQAFSIEVVLIEHEEVHYENRRFKCESYTLCVLRSAIDSQQVCVQYRWAILQVCVS